jgi:hypothetical protein
MFFDSPQEVAIFAGAPEADIPLSGVTAERNKPA